MITPCSKRQRVISRAELSFMRSQVSSGAFLPDPERIGGRLPRVVAA